jgi:hypothetical protein
VVEFTAGIIGGLIWTVIIGPQFSLALIGLLAPLVNGIASEFADAARINTLMQLLLYSVMMLGLPNIVARKGLRPRWPIAAMGMSYGTLLVGSIFILGAWLAFIVAPYGL